MQPGIRSLTIQNLLSFGDVPTTIELRPLNVLIGPNGSGKSNLIEVLGLLQNAPDKLATAISNGGGIDEWLWKGAVKTPTAAIYATLTRPSNLASLNSKPLRYRLEFTKTGFRFQISSEFVEDEGPLPDQRALELGLLPPMYYAFVNGHAIFNQNGQKIPLRFEDVNPQLSILAQRKDPEHYPEITYVGNLFASFRLYRDWQFGTIADVREPSDASLPNEYLEEDGANLGVVLDRLLAQPPVKRQILDSLRTFHEDAADLRTSVEGGKIQTRLEERHLRNGTIPLIRMSDGTVRWLALLAILLNPDPPPLVCIEEPELGLHPDMIPELAKLLIDASSRMQIIVTTHSDRLIEEFTEIPESVVVCEKVNGTSTLRRLSADKLSSWLRKYSLGELWTKGELGGTRW